MANRNHGYSNQSGSRRQSQDWREQGSRDDDDSRSGNYSSRSDLDENYDEGRVQSGRPYGSGEQSGSTGRHAGYGDFGRGEYGGGRSGWSGQDRYGQGGYGQGGGQRGYGQGGSNEGDFGQGRYGQGSSGSRGPGGSERSRYGQGNYRTEYGYGGSRGWNEPFGEGQQYGSQGEYGSQDYGSQGYGSGGGMGEHRGKGPKGYQRSDDRIKELICERLRDDPEIDPSEVTITVQGGRVTLEGTVDSRQTKNAIEDIADQFGNQDVQNNLRVQRPGQQTAEQGRQSRSATGTDESGTTKQKHN